MPWVARELLILGPRAGYFWQHPPPFFLKKKKKKKKKIILMPPQFQLTRRN